MQLVGELRMLVEGKSKNQSAHYTSGASRMDYLGDHIAIP